MATPDRAAAHDLELAALAAHGDRAAFGELVRRHGSAVRALMRKMGANAALADDLAQDAFVSAFEQITEFRGEGTFVAWVRKIAARAYARRLRRDRRLDFAAEVPEQEDRAGGPSAGDRIDLETAMRSLPEVERLCVSLCHGAGLSQSEIAAALNLPLGTVKSHVKRGLERLRARLEPSPLGKSAHA